MKPPFVDLKTVDERVDAVRADRVECVYPLSDEFRRKLVDDGLVTGVRTFSGMTFYTFDSVEIVRAQIDEALVDHD